MSYNMQVLYNSCVQHLDAVHRYSNIEFKFDFDGYDTWFCTSSIPETISTDSPSGQISVNEITNIFQVVGQVSELKPFEGPDSKGRISFWVEDRNDLISRALWSQIQKSLEAISKASGIAFNFSKLFEVDVETGVMRLRLLMTENTDVG